MNSVRVVIMKKKNDKREKIFVPLMGWLSGDKFSKHGNTYTGAVDAVGISFNAFCYKLVVDKSEEENPRIIAESYDVITKNSPDEHKKAEFPLTEEGRELTHAWLVERYEEYLSADRDEIPVSFK